MRSVRFDLDFVVAVARVPAVYFVQLQHLAIVGDEAAFTDESADVAAFQHFAVLRGVGAVPHAPPGLVVLPVALPVTCVGAFMRFGGNNFVPVSVMAVVRSGGGGHGCSGNTGKEQGGTDRHGEQNPHAESGRGPVNPVFTLMIRSFPSVTPGMSRSGAGIACQTRMASMAARASIPAWSSASKRARSGLSRSITPTISP